MKSKAPLVSCLTAAVLVSGCTSVRLPGVHRIDIQQGNIVDQDMVRQLRPGMEKRQVRFLLGTPLVVNAFDPNRWDYLYTLQEGNGRQKQQTLSVYFKDDELVRVAGDIRAIEENKISTVAAQSVVSVPDQRRDGGLFGWVASLLGIGKAGVAARDDEPVPAVRGAAAIEDPNSRLPGPR